MNNQTYRRIRIFVAIFVSITVSIATTLDSYLLAVSGVITGMLFLLLVRSKTKISVDEREITIREKAAQLTYSIFTPTIGLGSFFIMILSRGKFPYLESLGIIFSYLTLFLITVYSLSFFYLNRKYGGDNE